LTFDLLSDPGNRAAKTYGLVHTLPEDLRKIYLQFGRTGIIKYAEVNPDYTVRPEPEEIIGMLKGL